MPCVHLIHVSTTVLCHVSTSYTCQPKNRNMLRIYCRVPRCTDITRVRPKSVTYSECTVECSRVQISHVYTLQTEHAQNELLGAVRSVDYTFYVCSAACGRIFPTLPLDHMRLEEVPSTSPINSTNFSNSIRPSAFVKISAGISVVGQ